MKNEETRFSLRENEVSQLVGVFGRVPGDQLLSCHHGDLGRWMEQLDGGGMGSSLKRFGSSYVRFTFFSCKLKGNSLWESVGFSFSQEIDFLWSKIGPESLD